MGFFLSKLLVVTELKKGLHHSFFRVNVLWNFSDQLYCKTSQVEYYCSFQAFMRFYRCSERSHSIYLSKFGQLPLHSSATAIIIRLTKQLKIPYMQSVGAVLWNSIPEKESRNISRFLENLWVLFDKVIWQWSSQNISKEQLVWKFPEKIPLETSFLVTPPATNEVFTNEVFTILATLLANQYGRIHILSHNWSVAGGKRSENMIVFMHCL